MKWYWSLHRPVLVGISDQYCSDRRPVLVTFTPFTSPLYTRFSRVLFAHHLGCASWTHSSPLRLPSIYRIFEHIHGLEPHTQSSL